MSTQVAAHTGQRRKWVEARIAELQNAVNGALADVQRSAASGMADHNKGQSIISRLVEASREIDHAKRAVKAFLDREETEARAVQLAAEQGASDVPQEIADESIADVVRLKVEFHAECQKIDDAMQTIRGEFMPSNPDNYVATHPVVQQRGNIPEGWR